MKVFTAVLSLAVLWGTGHAFVLPTTRSNSLKLQPSSESLLVRQQQQQQSNDDDMMTPEFMVNLQEGMKKRWGIFLDSLKAGSSLKQAFANVLAGEYDQAAVQQAMESLIRAAPVVMFTWARSSECIKSVEALVQLAQIHNYLIVRLDNPFEDGNQMRAELGKAYGKTSVPAIFIGGDYVGSFDKGVSEAAPGIQALAFMGELHPKLQAAGAFERVPDDTNHIISFAVPKIEQAAAPTTSFAPAGTTATQPYAAAIDAPAPKKDWSMTKWSPRAAASSGGPSIASWAASAASEVTASTTTTFSPPPPTYTNTNNLPSSSMPPAGGGVPAPQPKKDYSMTKWSPRGSTSSSNTAAPANPPPPASEEVIQEVEAFYIPKDKEPTSNNGAFPAIPPPPTPTSSVSSPPKKNYSTTKWSPRSSTTSLMASANDSMPEIAPKVSNPQGGEIRTKTEFGKMRTFVSTPDKPPKQDKKFGTMRTFVSTPEKAPKQDRKFGQGRTFVSTPDKAPKEDPKFGTMRKWMEEPLSTSAANPPPATASSVASPPSQKSYSPTKWSPRRSTTSLMASAGDSIPEPFSEQDSNPQEGEIRTKTEFGKMRTFVSTPDKPPKQDKKFGQGRTFVSTPDKAAKEDPKFGQGRTFVSTPDKPPKQDPKFGTLRKWM